MASWDSFGGNANKDGVGNPSGGVLLLFSADVGWGFPCPPVARLELYVGLLWLPVLVPGVLVRGLMNLMIVLPMAGGGSPGFIVMVVSGSTCSFDMGTRIPWIPPGRFAFAG